METNEKKNPDLDLQRKKPSPEAIQLFNQEKYLSLIKETAENPHDEKTWDKIINLALTEKDEGIETYLPAVPLREMVDVGQKLQHASTQQERYHILFQQCSNGKLWYDIIQSENKESLLFITPFLEREQKNRGKKFERGLDIGTGSANATKIIFPFCKSVTGVDILYEVLKKAISRDDIGENSFFTQGDVTKLPYKNEAFDLVINNGLTLYLPKKTEQQLNEEIDRILQPNGIYITTLGKKSEDLIISGGKEVLKNIISWMIVSAAPKEDEKMKFSETKEQFISKRYKQVSFQKGDKNPILVFRKG